ncbi:MAG: amidohydrolase family protein [Streptosporangiaceae bacterium]
MATRAGPGRPKIIDSHQHFWDPSARAQPWLESDAALAPLRRRFAIADLAPQAEAAGVTGTVVVQTVTEPGETPELLALAAAEPLVRAVVGWADLTLPAAAAELARLSSLAGGRFLTGIRHPLLTEPDPDWLAGPDVRRGLSAVAAAGLCFDLVLQPSQLPGVIAVAAGLPELTFVLDHLGNVDAGADVDADWAAAFGAMAALPNTVCKLSGILGAASAVEIRPYFDLALDCFGPDRLMFGSDWPVCTLTASYATVVAAAKALTASLSEPEQQAILAGTASRVYRIGADE